MACRQNQKKQGNGPRRRGVALFSQILTSLSYYSNLLFSLDNHLERLHAPGRIYTHDIKPLRQSHVTGLG